MIGALKNLFKGPPPWVYLGWSDIAYADEKGTRTSECVIHFFARGDDFKERKYEYVGKGKHDLRWSAHPYTQKTVVPWVGGNNIWSAILNPSLQFQEWTKAKCGFEWKGKVWYKPAERIEANVLKFPNAK